MNNSVVAVIGGTMGTIQSYRVVMTFKYPAWDEKDGITYSVRAGIKSDACKQARDLARDDGHGGTRWFKAEVVDDE